MHLLKYAVSILVRGRIRTFYDRDHSHAGINEFVLFVIIRAKLPMDGCITGAGNTAITVNITLNPPASSL